MLVRRVLEGCSAATSSYVYDANDSLLLQKDPGSTTLYLPGEEITLKAGGHRSFRPADLAT